MELGYLTYKEFAFLLWKIGDCSGTYAESIAELKAYRNNETLFSLPEQAKNYTDAKPIMILIRWGFLSEVGKISGAKKIMVSADVKIKFETRLRNLKIYNIDNDGITKTIIMNDSIKKAKQEINREDEQEIKEDALFVSEVNKASESGIAIDTVSYKPREVVKPANVRQGSAYNRDPRVSRLAIQIAKNKCELCNEELRLFIRKSGGTTYTEPHHLIPVSCQSDLPDSKSLDHIANIVSLCSYCHNLLHYGRFEDKKGLIEQLYQERKEKLIEAEIIIDLETLLEIYN